MTPLVNPQSRQAHTTSVTRASYNERHTMSVIQRTCAVVEYTIGILKAKWMCLDTAGGKLLYTPEKACQIILVCCILHNTAMNEGVPIPSSTSREHAR